MIVETVVASCDENGCKATATLPAEGWLDLGGRDLCPQHSLARRVAAAAARAALAKPLPDAKRTVPARGTRRRLEALTAAGWSPALIRATLRLTPRAYSALLADADVLEQHAHRVAVLYQRIALLAPPRTTADEETAYLAAIGHAKQRRWVPPMGWDDIDKDDEPPVPDELGDDLDETAIDLAIGGERVRLRYAEKLEVVRRLHARGLSDPEIGPYVGVSGNGVFQMRKRNGLSVTEDVAA